MARKRPIPDEVPPPARGWSSVLRRSARRGAGSPACAGMVLLASPTWTIRSRFPRLRGDGPVRLEATTRYSVVPPPARGWSPTSDLSRGGHDGSPACAGMVHQADRTALSAAGFPRLRGDGPDPRRTGKTLRMVPPPARGWSLCFLEVNELRTGSPACAGMVRQHRLPVAVRCRFPRLRGDGPAAPPTCTSSPGVPPPARGWSADRLVARRALDGSPACAGMVPFGCHRGSDWEGFPRLRGDGPIGEILARGLARVPPPARGWSGRDAVVHPGAEGSPACAGMVRTASLRPPTVFWFPRLRGDGPVLDFSTPADKLVPPPARGWSGGRRMGPGHPAGSPACAGMVRRGCRSCSSRKGFPRLRGDGPMLVSTPSPRRWVPPPARGWSRDPPRHLDVIDGSPACAGMVRLAVE